MSYFHEFFGLAALLIGLSGYIIYIRSILRGDTKPHIFTHLVWGTITLIAFAAQIYDNAGPGAWVMGLSAFCCLLQAALAFKYGDKKDITHGDKIALGASLLAIIPWLLSRDPLWSVILIAVIDGVAFYPTIRKSWRKPWDENLTAYNMASFKFVLSLLAMTNFTIVTTLYAFTVIVLNSSFSLMCLIRRQNLPKTAQAIK